ncbi:MAG: RyR domain-containing protein [Rikenellaceae bacterium]
MKQRDISFDLSSLYEDLARHVHNTWMQGRIDDGWVYGEELSDTLKIHPSIIPYEELSEEEKDYDRRTSQATLQFIIEQGYKIVKTEK